MPMTSEWADAQTSDGAMRVYVSSPGDGARHAGLVVLQEVFGVNDHIQELTRRLAAEGFVAAAPEIYHRLDTREVPYTDPPAGIALKNQLTEAQVAEDIRACVGLLTARADVDGGKLGMVGFCYGGRATYLLGSQQPELRALVCFYPEITANDPVERVENAAKQDKPILAFFGDKDFVVPMDQVERVRGIMGRVGNGHEVVVYAGAGHGFFCDARPAYNPQAAADAWPRTLAFLREHLSG